MTHLPHLIQDLAIILMTAGVVSVVFRRIGQPVVLGYIIAGFLIGPNVPLFPSISDLPNIQIWAEIGIIFLLFALGLEFSFKKVIKVGGAATVTATIEVLSMIAIGYMTGQLLSWAFMDSLFLGGILAISSTTIIIRAFEESGVKSRGFVSLVLGVLIIEDLVAILLLVLLSTLAIGRQFDGFEMLISVWHLFFFIAIWFLSGIFILPSLFRLVRQHMSEEMLLVVSLGLCFLMVVLATQSGFSAALGAFMMGSIFAETREAERIEAIIKPVKDLFAAVFFVSVGMLINPQLLIQFAGPIVMISIVTILGKVISTLIGALMAGRSLRHGVQAGLSVAQIGEFSFIIATLGLTLKVTSDFLYPIAVGVSVLTTFSTPYLIRWADDIFYWIDGRLPHPLKEFLVRYAVSVQKVSHKKEWHSVLKSYALTMVVNGVIISAIFILFSRVLPRFLGPYFSKASLMNLVGLSIALIGSAPFLWAFFMRKPKPIRMQDLWKNKDYRVSFFFLECLRFLAGVSLVGFLTSQFVSLKTSVILTMFVVMVSLFLFSQYLKIIYVWFEKHFFLNLTAREELTDHRLLHQDHQSILAPWDAHITYFYIPAESSLIGKTLSELGVREKMGVTIALIERGQHFIPGPSGKDVLYPGDRLAVMGTDDQIVKFGDLLKAPERPRSDFHPLRYGLHHFEVQDHMSLSGKTIRESGLREKINGLVVGIERNGVRTLNPHSNSRFETGDVVWVVCDSEKKEKALF